MNREVVVRKNYAYRNEQFLTTAQPLSGRMRALYETSSCIR